MQDYELHGREFLEPRVCELFRQLGFKVTPDPRGNNKEDLLLEAPAEWTPQNRIVVEVKSTIVDHKKSPAIRDLRELDDWVFDVSGEKDIRGRSLTRWKNPLLIEQHIGTANQGHTYLTTAGAIPYSPVHLSPVKGLLMFNGPTTTPFDCRDENWLGHNEREFAEIRSFCVLSLQSLLKWIDAFDANADLNQFFWRTLHETSGLCPDPPT